MCIKGKLPNKMWLICPVETVVPPGVFSQLKDSQTIEKKIQFSFPCISWCTMLGWDGIWIVPREFFTPILSIHSHLCLSARWFYTMGMELFLQRRETEIGVSFLPRFQKNRLQLWNPILDPNLCWQKWVLGKKNLQL